MFTNKLSEFGDLKLILKLLLLLLTSGCVQSGDDVFGHNYPSSGKPKLCAPKNSTINYVGPLCVPDVKNGWRQDSVDNCRGPFKDTCPEFNVGECEWYSWRPTDPKLASLIGNQSLAFPCCRLKYYAKIYPNPSKTTWMEIYYTNQYGTWDTSVFDVIELHRYVKYDDYFYDLQSGDFPESVLDPYGERGLSWKAVDPADISLVVDDICADHSDFTIANTLVLNYLKAKFPDGFDKNKLPPVSEREKNENHTIMFDREATCSHGMIGGRKTPVSAVIYTRQTQRAPYMKNNKMHHPGPGLKVPYLQAMVYNNDRARQLFTVQLVCLCSVVVKCSLGK